MPSPPCSPLVYSSCHWVRLYVTELFCTIYCVCEIYCISMTSGSVTFRKLYSRAHDDIIVIWWCHHVLLLYCMHPNLLASFPGLHAQLLLLALRKARGRPGRIFLCDACHCWRHVQSAHVWVCSLSFSLLSLNSVCPESPIATESIVASYSTWRQQQHASHNKSFQAFPRFSYYKQQKYGRGGLGTRLPIFHFNVSVSEKRVALTMNCD